MFFRRSNIATFEKKIKKRNNKTTLLRRVSSRGSFKNFSYKVKTKDKETNKHTKQYDTELSNKILKYCSI